MFCLKNVMVLYVIDFITDLILLNFETCTKGIGVHHSWVGYMVYTIAG